MLQYREISPHVACFTQEDDPLDAFMADLNNMDKQPDAPAIPDKKRKADVGLDEEADNVADFLEVHVLQSTTLNMLPPLSQNIICLSLGQCLALCMPQDCTGHGALLYTLHRSCLAAWPIVKRAAEVNPVLLSC